MIGSFNRGRRPILRGTHRSEDRWPLAVSASILWIVIVVVCGLAAPILAPFDPVDADLRQRLLPPSFDLTHGHLLGTDYLGRDLLSRLMHASRSSLLIALIGVFTGAIIGTSLGMAAAHFGPVVDEPLSILIDIQAATPFFVLAVMIIAVFGTSFTVLLFLVGIYGWERYARLARALSRSAIEDGYAKAATLYGAGWIWIYGRHVLPNIAATIAVNMTLNFPEIVILESALSFLGLGVQPPVASLGSMLSSGREYLLDSWWLAALPGAMIFLTTLSTTLIGDWLRDRLDPTSSR